MNPVVLNPESIISFGGKRQQGYSRLMRLPEAWGRLFGFSLYAKYQGFCSHDPPVPGPAVIMHCSNEVKVHVVPVHG